jgi:hypothetical protein
MAARVKMTVLDDAPCSLVEAQGRFRAVSFLHDHLPDDGGSKHL